jgi:hypothetical protein
MKKAFLRIAALYAARWVTQKVTGRRSIRR